MVNTEPAQNLPVDSVADEDRIDKVRTMFDVSITELMWRNFLAGVSRAVGSIVVYLIFATVGLWILAQVLLPIFGPFIENLNALMQSVNGTQQTIQESQSILDQLNTFGGRRTSPSPELNGFN